MSSQPSLNRPFSKLSDRIFTSRYRVSTLSGGRVSPTLESMYQHISIRSEALSESLSSDLSYASRSNSAPLNLSTVRSASQSGLEDPAICLKSWEFQGVGKDKKLEEQHWYTHKTEMTNALRIYFEMAEKLVGLCRKATVRAGILTIGQKPTSFAWSSETLQGAEELVDHHKQMCADVRRYTLCSEHDKEAKGDCRRFRSDEFYRVMENLTSQFEDIVDEFYWEIFKTCRRKDFEMLFLKTQICPLRLKVNKSPPPTNCDER